MAARSLAVVALCIAVVHAHGDHHHGPSEGATKQPVDFWLGLHIALESLSWAVLFPLAMVLGLVRHKLHVPISIAAVTISIVGYFFGSHHGGRQFRHTVHGNMAPIMLLSLILQMACGIYLKLHLTWKPERVVRPVVLGVHGFLGRAFPLLGWIQMIFGIATLQSWCNGGRLGQCLAHYIMGSAFTAYSVILLIMLKCAANWLARRHVSQEYMDSWVILLWGIVNTFTEHHGGPWTHKDLQHTLMGVLWWAGGMVGVWLSRKGQRSVFPAIIIAITGWAMSGHAQALMLSTMVHGQFGYALMAAGLCRLIEICFVLQDRPTGEASHEASPGAWFHIHAFQYLPPFLLVCSGVMFMSATDEEMRWAHAKGIDHVTWGLIDFSIAFTLFFWFNLLIDTYVAYGGRYGLVNGSPSAEIPSNTAQGASWHYTTPAEPPATTLASASREPSESIPMNAYVQRTSLSPSFEQHVLFDENEDPFDDEYTALQGDAAAA